MPTAFKTTVQVIGFDHLDARLSQLKKIEQRAVVKTALTNAGHAVAGWARENIRSQGLIDTGALVNSVSVLVRGAEVWIYSGLVYAAIQEVGGHIAPVNGKYLTIPLTSAAKKIGGARNWPGKLHKQGMTLADEQGIPQYALSTGVDIPARPWLAPAITQHLDDIRKVISTVLAAEISKIWSGQ
jgi:hypothetical protein